MTDAALENAIDLGDDSEPGSAPRPVRAAARRRRTPALMGALALLAALGATTWFVLHRGEQSTDDAQVEGRVMTVAARVNGQVLRVRVIDNQVVRAGDVLLELDPAGYAARANAARADVAAARAAADSARAALALTERSAPAVLAQALGGLTAATSSLASARDAVEQAGDEVAAATAQRTYAEINLARSTALLRQNAVPQAEVDLRRSEFDAAEARLSQARSRVAASRAMTAGSGGGVALARGRLAAAQTTTEQIAAARAAVALADAHVQQAEAALRLAELDLSYTVVRAPRGGVVSRRSVEEGQSVGPDRALMAIVPSDEVWVVANLKEDQLAEVRAGQRARVRFDVYGRREFVGHVESISNGTGARFALLPPDNASGNFVKVVQRVPVLIRLDGAIDVPLRPGMSAEATVDTRPR